MEYHVLDVSTGTPGAPPRSVADIQNEFAQRRRELENAERDQRNRIRREQSDIAAKLLREEPEINALVASGIHPDDAKEVFEKRDDWLDVRSQLRSSTVGTVVVVVLSCVTFLSLVLGFIGFIVSAVGNEERFMFYCLGIFCVSPFLGTFCVLFTDTKICAYNKSKHKKNNTELWQRYVQLKLLRANRVRVAKWFGDLRDLQARHYIAEQHGKLILQPITLE